MVLNPYFLLNSVVYTVYLIIALSAAFGAVQVSMTRDDAFEAADRQQKWIWCAILAASAPAIALRFPIFEWVAIVATGVYFFDVRPQIKDIISGRYFY